MTDPATSSRLARESSARVVRLDVDAIVLDIDDTLFLERDYVRSGFDTVGTWVSSQLGLEGFGTLAWSAFEAGSRHRIFDEVLKSFGYPSDPSLIEQMVARYRNHSPVIGLAPDARDALDRWHGRVALAAITDGPLMSQRAKATTLALDAWVQPIVFTAALGDGMGKPHPAAFEFVQEQLGVDGSHCVYVADNPSKDFIAPKKLGWQTVRVRRPLGLHARAAGGMDVDFEVSSLDDLDCSPTQ